MSDENHDWTMRSVLKRETAKLADELRKEINKSGRPQNKKAGVHIVDNVDAQAQKVDAHTIINVDAQTPTLKKRGRPIKNNVDAHKKDRHTKTRARVSLRPEVKILNKFKEFCKSEKLEMQEFFELAGVHYMNYVDAHKKEMWTPLDDNRRLIIYKSSISIINLYEKYNEKNSWKAQDDREAEKFNNADPRIIEAAIIMTQINAGFKRIHSFKYYTSEVENLIAANISTETLDIMLASYRRNWQAARNKK